MAPKSKRFKKDSDSEISMESPIGKLPEEVLLKVFEFLDARTLKDSTLVCKKWDKIIGFSMTLMNKFQLSINANKQDKEMLNSRRKHVTIQADLCRRLFHPVKTAMFNGVIKRFGANLQELELIDSSNSAKSLTKMLKNLPLLKELKLEQRWSDEGGMSLEPAEEEISPVNMAHLTTLKLLYYGSHVCKFISAPQLKTLDIDGSIEHDFMAFTNFLKSTPNLQSLKCKSKWIAQSFKIAEGGFPFKLKFFIEHYENRWNDHDISKFLLSQASSLEGVDYTCLSQSDFNFLLSNFKNIQVWRNQSMKLLPKEKEFYDQLQPTRLTEIHSIDGFASETAARGNMQICPELEVLDIPNDQVIYKMLPFVAENNPKIKSMSIRRLPDQCEACFPSLKTLIIENKSDDNSSISSFLEANQTIETLKIDWIENQDYKSFNQFNVKHLNLHGGIILKEIYDYIKAEPKSIKTLELSSTNYNGWSFWSLVFKFPEEIWKWSRDHERFYLESPASWSSDDSSNYSLDSDY